ncbi:MAG: hypothetical protein IT210_15795 [Armatimonadetes bacterium]|nr:hypothetical protein [Armatimonadota bacterium]
MKAWRWPALAALLFCALALAEGAAQSRYARLQGSKGAPDGAGVLRQLAGEFRHVFANLLWVKVDRYHHEMEEHHGKLKDDSNLMPIIRMITWLDPEFVEAYAVGGWLLVHYLGKPAEGKRFLDEGIARNPRRYELYESLGWYYAKRERNADRALHAFRQALECPMDDFDRKRLMKLCRTIKKSHRKAERGA